MKREQLLQTLSQHWGIAALADLLGTFLLRC